MNKLPKQRRRALEQKLTNTSQLNQVPAPVSAAPLTEVDLVIRYNFATDTITALQCSAPTAGAHLLQRVLSRAQTHVFTMTVSSYEALLASLQEQNKNGQS